MSHRTAPRTAPGFTLFEIVVAMGIFAFVLLLVVGSFSRFTRIERRTIGEQQMQEDIRLTLQLFNREARTAFGSTYSTSHNGQAITFRNQERVCVKYQLTGEGQLERSEVEADGDIDCTGADYPSEGRILTDSDTTVIDNLEFTAQPASVEDPGSQLLGSQGYITVRMAIRSNLRSEPVNFQSAITSRQLRAYTPQ